MKDIQLTSCNFSMENYSLQLVSRRRFLTAAGGFAASAAVLRAQDVMGANDQVRVGLIGCGERGTGLAMQLQGTKNARMVAVSDPDTDHLAKVAKKLGGKVDQIRDYRKLLERKDIDAVIIASPNFWHALHMIHACQAGKDVYVEKPVSGDAWSGRQMAAAVQRYGRIVQAGTQNRSDTGLIPALQYIKEGNIGKITAMYGTCFRNRSSIGKIDKPITPPATLDYDLWLGPAQDKPIYRPHLHYDWHWDYNTGNGDIGNQGPHELDLLAWFSGDPELPSEMYSFGGRFGWDDGGNTANMQTAAFSLNGIPCTFEVNNMWLTPTRNVDAVYKGIRTAIIVTGEKGEFRGGRGGGYVLGPDGVTKMAKFPGDAGGNHMQNFIDAVRSRRSQDLAAPISSAHKSAALAHYANISLRTGEQIPLEKIPSAIPQTELFADVIARQHKQLHDWNIDFAKVTCSVGAKVSIDPKTGLVSGSNAIKAFNVPNFRKGYEVPEIG